MHDFKGFAQAIYKHFAVLSANELYRAKVPGDELWQTYLAAFPEGTNPIYKTNTYHDGNYDKAFIRRLGNVVHVDEAGKIHTLWSAANLPYPYNEVANVLDQKVRAAPLDTLFRIKDSTLGYESTVQEIEGGDPIRWHHFHAKIASRHVSASPAADLGNAAGTIQVMGRGFDELTFEALDTVLDLIESNTLYRGAEFKAGVQNFRRVKQRYQDAVGDQERSMVLWGNVNSPSMRIRNTAIGTLLIDLSNNVELEAAVRKYERVVAPTNYKRPTALVTPAMVAKATETIRELGLESALERRHARLDDIAVTNVIWANRSAAKKMKGGVLDSLMEETSAKAKPTKDAKDIAIDLFVSEILPAADTVELQFLNPLQANLMSLTAPVDGEPAGAGGLFKWGNNFAWSYVGDITDSIKEKVKVAGGNTNAMLRVSLAWYNHDDLDLHSRSPDGYVWYAQKGGDNWNYRGPNGQILDVDMNASGGQTREPVENQSWKQPADGRYLVSVNQFSRRETSNVGFTIEVENDGKVTQYSYPHAVSGTIEVLDFTVKDQKIATLKSCDSKIVGQGIERTVWGINTETFVPVNTIMHSPNHWDGERTGNKHWFFILKGCANPDPIRGIYNEFLKPELEEHRKVFEVLGNKTKCEPTADQLSGLGFSSTKRDSVLARVTTASAVRMYKINF